MTTIEPVESVQRAAQQPIRELAERVAAQIAAGEVIERPAAVLKELLENAVDAGAGRIAVELTGAGRELIAVHDDGRGIAADQVALAFRRHATSKLAQVDDLARLESYGFRGEALPAIAAVAGRLTLTTRTAPESAATLIEFEQGRQMAPRPAARAVGTSVEVVDLFAGQPARRAFLAGRRAERSALLRVASDSILANPDCALRLMIDGRTPLAHESQPHESQPAGDWLASLRAALASVFRPEAAERALVLEAASERAAVTLEGFAGSPADARRTRDAIRLFVNGRPVHDRRLSYAVQEAYRDWLSAGSFPLVVARLTVPPEAVDVNVHPAKTEVKLRDPAAAFSLLQRTIRAALSGDRYASPRRLGAERSRDDAVGAAAAAAADRLASGTLEPPERQGGPTRRQPSDNGESPWSGETQRGAAARLLPMPRMALPRTSVAVGESAPTLDMGLRKGPMGVGRDRLPPLRMVGQLHRTFIIGEGPHGLVLIDQHAAHERVLYERLLAADGAHGSSNSLWERGSQPLLTALVISLDAQEAAHWDAAAERLGELGFESELFGERALRLHALPGALASADAERVIRGVLSDLGPGPDEPERFDRAAASAACHGSVRRGAVLDPQAMTALLRDLEQCANPHSCPHGRPTLVEIAATDVLRQFGRI